MMATQKKYSDDINCSEGKDRVQVKKRDDAVNISIMRKLEETDAEVFTYSGECQDEITFVFDDKRKLYVSLNFLMYVSPVFKAMFTHDFQERKTREVALPGKEYEGFLEFLLCLHPNRQKPVDGCTVFRMLELAEEYQSSPIIQKCKAVMINWLQSVPEKPTKLKTYYSYAAEQDEEILSYISYCRACIMILGTAIGFQYEELVSTAVDCIARFGFQIFSGIPRPVCGNKNQELIDTELKQCKNMYDQLPEPVKQRLLKARLQQCDNWK